MFNIDVNDFCPLKGLSTIFKTQNGDLSSYKDYNDDGKNKENRHNVLQQIVSLIQRVLTTKFQIMS